MQLELDREGPIEDCENCGADGFLVYAIELFHACDPEGGCAGGCLDGGCSAILGVACEQCFEDAIVEEFYDRSGYGSDQGGPGDLSYRLAFA